MSPFKFGLLVAAASLTPPAWMATAEEPRIILAQQGQPPLTPQQQEEEKKKREQQKKAQDQQKAQQQQKVQQQLEQQKRHAQELQQQQQQKALEQKKTLDQQQLKEQELQKRHAQELQQQQKALDQKKAQEQQQKVLEQQKLDTKKQQQLKAQELQKAQQQQKVQAQQKTIEQQKAQAQQLQQQKALQLQAEQKKLKDQADAQKKALEDAQRKGDKQRILQLQKEEQARLDAEKRLREEQQKSGLALKQANEKQQALQRQLSAEFQKGKAEREAHRKQLQQVIQRERQDETQERSQAAINERLRIENAKLKTLHAERKQFVDKAGQTVIQEPGRTIYNVHNQYFIQHNGVERLSIYGGNAHTRQVSGGNTISTIVRPDGVRIEIELDSYGRPLRRVRILPDGRRFVLFENRPFAAGVGFAFGGFLVDLPPPVINIPRERYVVNAYEASEDDIYDALDAPPIEPVEAGYSLDQVLASVNLRDRMRSIDIDTIHFGFGAWDISPDQADLLESVAAVIKSIVSQNPGELFLIEGHTDAVGSVVDNLSLSDRRAEAVADVLAKQFGVPAENLVTHGYGKEFLLVQTDGPEWRNRRVVIRRITPLLSSENDSQYSGEGDGDGESGMGDGGRYSRDGDRE